MQSATNYLIKINKSWFESREYKFTEYNCLIGEKPKSLRANRPIFNSPKDQTREREEAHFHV